MNETPLTVGQLSKLFHQPYWRIRQVVDSIAPDLPRVGQYRILPTELLPAVEAKLRELGCLKEQETAK